MAKRKAFKDLKAGHLKEVERPYAVPVGCVRVIINRAKDDCLILEGKIRQNFDLIDLAELSEETC